MQPQQQGKQSARHRRVPISLIKTIALTFDSIAVVDVDAASNPLACQIPQKVERHKPGKGLVAAVLGLINVCGRT